MDESAKTCIVVIVVFAVFVILLLFGIISMQDSTIRKMTGQYQNNNCTCTCEYCNTTD